MSLSHKARGSAPVPPTSTWGSLGAPFFHKNSVARTLWEKWRPERPKVGPRAAKGAQMEPQSSLWGALGRLFSRKTAIVGPCQNLTPAVVLALKHRSGASLGGLKAPLFRVGGVVRSLGAFLGRPGRKKGPKGGPRCPKALQSDARERPKST